MDHLPVTVLIFDITQGKETELFFNYYFIAYLKTKIALLSKAYNYSLKMELFFRKIA